MSRRSDAAAAAATTTTTTTTAAAAAAVTAARPTRGSSSGGGPPRPPPTKYARVDKFTFLALHATAVRNWAVRRKVTNAWRRVGISVGGVGVHLMKPTKWNSAALASSRGACLAVDAAASAQPAAAAAPAAVGAAPHTAALTRTAAAAPAPAAARAAFVPPQPPVEYIPQPPPLDVRAGSKRGFEHTIEQQNKQIESLRSIIAFQQRDPRLPCLGNREVFGWEAAVKAKKDDGMQRGKRVSQWGAVNRQAISAAIDEQKAEEQKKGDDRAAAEREREERTRSFALCAAACVCGRGSECTARRFKQCAQCGEVKKNACQKAACKEKRQSTAAASTAAAPAQLPLSAPPPCPPPSQQPTALPSSQWLPPPSQASPLSQQPPTSVSQSLQPPQSMLTPMPMPMPMSSGSCAPQFGAAQPQALALARTPPAGATPTAQPFSGFAMSGHSVASVQPAFSWYMPPPTPTTVYTQPHHSSVAAAAAAPVTPPVAPSGTPM